MSTRMPRLRNKGHLTPFLVSYSWRRRDESIYVKPAHSCYPAPRLQLKHRQDPRGLLQVLMQVYRPRYRPISRPRYRLDIALISP